MRIKNIILGLLATSTMAGCSVSNTVDRDIRADASESADLLNQARNPSAADKSQIKVSDEAYIGTKTIRNDQGDPLPARFEKPNAIVIGREAPYDLREIASKITERTQIPVVLAAAPAAGQSQSAPQATGSADASTVTQSAPSPLPNNGPVPPGFPLEQALAEISATAPSAAPAAQGGMITASSSGVSDSTMPLKYTGSLSGLLDMVGAHFNVAWKYEKGRIVIDSTVTRSFDVPALATVTGLNFSLGSQGAQSGSNGGKASNQANVDFYAELDAGIKALVGEGSYSINKVGGVVTVTANPATVDRVQTYLDAINERTSEQVNLDIKVYSVTMRDSEDLNFNLTAALKEATKYGLGLAGNGTSSAIAGGGSLSWALLQENDKWSGSKATLQALSERGDVAEVTSAVVQTVNGQPVPFQVGLEREYIPKITREEDSDGNISISNETAEISSGFGLQMVPRIERNGDILLQYGIDISSLVGADDGFDTREIGGETLQLKRVAKRNFLQQARIPHKTTLVLAGFEQTKSTTSKSGIGHPNFSLFGGGSSSQKEKEILVIMITPTILKK
jgi:type IVB pilus formation R64 PilN family outer membrane protein